MPNNKKKPFSYLVERTSVTSRLPHAAVTKDPNPYCKRCGWRTYPLWGPHDCRQGIPVDPEQVARIRHIAGDLLSTLHFYRRSPEEQVAALVYAFSYALGRNCEPRRALKRWRGIQPKIEKLIRREAGGNADGIVAATAFGPMKAKKSKQVRHDTRRLRRRVHSKKEE